MSNRRMKSHDAKAFDSLHTIGQKLQNHSNIHAILNDFDALAYHRSVDFTTGKPYQQNLHSILLD